MGNTKSYPNATEEVESTIFMVDYICWGITAFCKTILLTVWVLHAFCNMNIIPTKSKKMIQQQSVSPAQESDKVSRGTIGSELSDDVQESAIMSASDDTSISMDPTARLYITLSAVAALIYSYLYVLLHTLRYLGFVDNFSCALPAISLGVGWASNRLFLYLYLMHRLKASFHGTFLEMKQSQYNILMRMYCVLMTLGVLWYICYATYVGCDNMGILTSFIPLNVADSFCAAVCLFIFIKKLKCVLNMKKSQYERDPIGMNDIKRLVNKFLIISLFAIAFTYFVSLWFFIYPMKSLAGIDTMVNVFCLMITTWSYDLYYRLSCVLCRGCCEKKFNLTGTEKTDPTPGMIIH